MNAKFIILAILGVMVLVGGILFTLNGDILSDDRQACTMEALLCPDGSAVGRTGALCTFAPCADGAGPYTGTLERTDGVRYRLILGAPQGAGTQEVSYVMPLQISSDISLQGLLNRRVEVRGSFIEGNTLQVTEVRGLAGDAGDPALGTVPVGATRWINGVSITLHEMVQDSRCPIDTNCIEGGAVVVNVTLESDTDRERRNLPSDEVPYAFDRFRVSIDRVAPPLYSDEEIDPDDYAVTFRVVENAN